jgi:hypothetical protein
MASHYWNVISKNTAGAIFARRARRGAVALEFAILAFPFFLWLLFIFELSYDLFTQEALDGALQIAVRQIETGNATNLSGGGAFIGDYLCGAAKGLLECNKMWINVTPITPPPQTASVPVTPTTQVIIEPDFSSFTTGSVPMNGDALDLANFTNISNGSSAPGSTTPPANAFCNASASQAILVSVIYVGPSFIGGMLPGVLSAQFAGSTVHPTLSTAGFVTEAFPAGVTPANTTAAKTCA